MKKKGSWLLKLLLLLLSSLSSILPNLNIIFCTHLYTQLIFNTLFTPTFLSSSHGDPRMQANFCLPIWFWRYKENIRKRTERKYYLGHQRIFTVFNPTPVIIPTELEVSCFHVLDKDVRSSDIRPIMTEIFGRSFFIPLAKNLPLVGPCYFTPRIIYFIEAFMSPFLLHLPI